MVGFYFLSVLLILAFVLEPDLTGRILLAAFLKMEVWIMNLRLKWAAWRIYRQLVSMCKQHGLPEPGPFKFVDIWERDSLN
jgi:hypothetical protein